MRIHKTTRLTLTGKYDDVYGVFFALEGKFTRWSGIAQKNPHLNFPPLEIDKRMYLTRMKYIPLLFTKIACTLFVLMPLRSTCQQSVKLVWSDEFDYNGLPDSTKWNYDTGGHGWGNNELQYYTALRRENARVENGHLIIEARKESYEGKNYTSARMVTRGKGEWTYGKVEVRARIPKGVGTWPAIWMLSGLQPLQWPDDGEIDIMEHVGYDQGRIHGTVHTKKYNHVIGTQKSATVLSADCSDAYHVYSVTWNKERIEIAMDGKPFFTYQNEHSGYGSWPFDHPFYLLLNIAVGGNWGGQKGVDESIWPLTMEVDYVRVYQ